MPELEAPTIIIKRWATPWTTLVTDSDHKLDVFSVQVANQSYADLDEFYCAEEGLGSEAELRAFLRGVQAGCGACGVYVPNVEIPQEPSGKLDRKPILHTEDDPTIPF